MFEKTRRFVMLSGLATVASAALPNLTLAQSSQETSAPEIIDMVMGDENAPVTLIEYASFTCPHCARFHSDVMPELKKNYIDTGKVKFIYREVYFDKYGLWASAIARCVDPQSYFAVSGMIFDNLRDWARGSDTEVVEALKKFGLTAGLERDQVEHCLQDRDKLVGLLEWYQKNAAADDVNSTPTLIIDGQKYSNMPYDELSAILDEKIGN